MWGNETEVLDGTQLAADYTFAGLQKFGQGLEERLRGLKMKSKILEKVGQMQTYLAGQIRERCLWAPLSINLSPRAAARRLGNCKQLATCQTEFIAFSTQAVGINFVINKLNAEQGREYTVHR